MKKKLAVLLIGTCFTVALMSGCGQRINGVQQGQESSTTQTQSNNTTGQNSQNGTAQNSTTASITQDDAKTIALNHAGVAEADTIGLSVRQDFDNGMTLYEVDIYTPATDYEYEINAADGTIIKENRSTPEQVMADPGAAVTPDQAKEIVLAKVSGASEQNLRMTAERDGGRIFYEGEVIYNGMSYDFELDAQTGSVLEWSEETLGY